MNEVKFLKIQAMTKTLLMNSLQLPIGMILTIMVILQVLKDTDPKRFHNFPSSSHNAKKLLQIEKNAKTYAVCPKCNKLHKTAEISEDNKCKFVEFPKHPMKKYRVECGAELLKNIPVTNGYIK